jgi:Ni,Fe-hydrogenase I large subunit
VLHRPGRVREPAARVRDPRDAGLIGPELCGIVIGCGST